ncbi:MAG: hypothetical protein U0T36_03690 [Saprospiraceae bacterium]
MTFNIQVCNQGTDPVTSVSLIDYIPSGFTFSPNNGWTSSGPNAVRTLTPLVVFLAGRSCCQYLCDSTY